LATAETSNDNTTSVGVDVPNTEVAIDISSTAEQGNNNSELEVDTSGPTTTQVNFDAPSAVV